MNFDFDEALERMRQSLAGVLGGLKSGLEKEIPEDIEAETRGLMRALAGTDFYLKSGSDPERLKESPHFEALTSAILGEELARLSPSMYLSVETSARMFGWLVARFGDDLLRQKYLPPLRQGELIGAVARAELCGNFPGEEIRTEARREGEQFIITGLKKQVLNAPVADVLAVVGAAEGRPAVFLLERGQAGLETGENQKTLGFNGVTRADVRLNGCRAPAANVMALPDGAKCLAELKTRENLILTVASFGVMDRALKAASAYAGESIDGRKPAMAFQELRFRLAEMYTLCSTSRWMIYRAAWMLESRAAEAETVAASAKVFVTEAAEEVSRNAVQVMAGNGYLAGNEAERSFRDARFGPIAGETSEVLRMRIAGDCLRKYE